MEFWETVTIVIHILATFDITVFKVSMGLFGTFGTTAQRGE